MTLVRLESKASSPPATELADNEVVVEHRVHECLLGLVVVHIDATVVELLLGVLALDGEVLAPCVEVVPLVHTRQVDRRKEILAVGIGDAVVAVERPVAGGVERPAEHPVRTEVEGPDCVHAAPEIPVAAKRFAVVLERLRILLEYPRRADLVSTVE